MLADSWGRSKTVRFSDCFAPSPGVCLSKRERDDFLPVYLGIFEGSGGEGRGGVGLVCSVPKSLFVCPKNGKIKIGEGEG